MTPQPNRDGDRTPADPETSGFAQEVDGESDLAQSIKMILYGALGGSEARLNYTVTRIMELPRLRTLEARLDDSDANVGRIRCAVPSATPGEVRAILAAIKRTPDEQ